MPTTARPEPVRAPPSVEMRDLTTVRAGRPVLHELRLTVPAGRLTVLMGPSGSGKTTLLKHVVGLLEPDLGTVLIDGWDVWAAGHRELAAMQRGISPMLGGASLFDSSVFGSLSVLDNVVQQLKLAGAPSSRWRERAVAQLTELHLDDVLEHLPSALPGHARRRLALARALVLDAPLTILDEVDVGLDPRHRAAVMAAIRGLRRRTGGTVLVTTHTPELARALAEQPGDQLAVLVNGRVLLAGAAGEVLDGVPDAAEFLRRVELSDHAGPRRLAGARLAVGRERTRRSSDLPTNPWLVVAGLLGVLLTVLALLAALGRA